MKAIAFLFSLYSLLNFVRVSIAIFLLFSYSFIRMVLDMDINKKKEVFLQFIEILNIQDEKKQKGEVLELTLDQDKIMELIEDFSKDDVSIAQFIEKIKEALPEERQKLVEEYFSLTTSDTVEDINSNRESEEEVIAKTFGVDVSEVSHKYLENGLEVFVFYDNKSNREVLLQNEINGRSLKSYLMELQEQNENFQTESAEKNIYNILMDERNHKNLELSMYNVEDISNHYEEISHMSKNDLLKLNYLLRNCGELRVQSINLGNLVFLDTDNLLHEVTFNDQNEIIVAEPKGEKESSKVEKIGENDILGDLPKESKEEEYEKSKVYTYTNKDGYANITLFAVLLSTLVVSLILYFVFHS